MCERVVKPFCDRCIYTPERCYSCLQIPPTHLQLLDIASGKSHVAPVYKLSKIDPIDLKDITISLDALTGINKGVLKMPKGIPEYHIWNYDKKLQNIEKDIHPCAHEAENEVVWETDPEMDDIPSNPKNDPVFEKNLPSSDENMTNQPPKLGPGPQKMDEKVTKTF